MTGLHSVESYYRQGATRLGIPFEEYRQHIGAGERWCSGHRLWESRLGFGLHRGRRDGLNSICVDFSRENARRNMARLRARQKEAR